MLRQPSVQNYPYNDIAPPAGAPMNVGTCGDHATQEDVSACIARCDNYGAGCAGILFGVNNHCCYLKSTLANKTPAGDAVAYTKTPPYTYTVQAGVVRDLMFQRTK